MTYNADPLVDAFEKNFSEIDGKIFFTVPDIDQKLLVDEDEYYFYKTRVNHLSGISKFLNVAFSICGMLILLWFVLVKGNSFIYFLPVWAATLLLGVVSARSVLRSAIQPFSRRLREEWARANGLASPTSLSGTLDILKAQGGNIIVLALLWSFIGLREILHWLN